MLIRLGYSYIAGFLRVLTKRFLERGVFLYYNNFRGPGPVVYEVNIPA